MPAELVGSDLLKDIIRPGEWNAVRDREDVLVPGWRRIEKEKDQEEKEQKEKEQKEKEQREREQVERDTRERLDMETDLRMTDDQAYAAGGLQGLNFQ